MKDEKAVRRSARARLNQAQLKCASLAQALEALRADFSPTGMATARALAEEIVQSVHEFNAYHNVLIGEPMAEGK